ncbi:MAG: DNA polymerase III subunit gamma/tau [Bacillus sp. (in: firmicutes)]
MGYQALYRVWRPQQFSDVIGQKHVTKTMQNALEQEKISHAYLFSGPRGTGKTSVAKILAKAVNCEHSPTREPCNECPSCLGITDGSISDVIEIDAASNNGVDEIRDIRDKVKYAPNSVKYKVYIIDEVHMLSTGAFNALLKTLEEPPKHVIFILATTEPHKIPLTIISRCQRFDFKRIGPEDIVERMHTIIDHTGNPCDEQALYIIARAAEGGMRDALSLLDQAISFSTNDHVTVEDALTVTGSVSQIFINDLVHAIHHKDVSKALGLLKELLSLGKDPVRLIEDLILYFRDMLLYQVSPELSDSFERVVVDDDFKELANQVHASSIYQMIDSLNKAQQEMKWTNHPRVLLEVMLVKLCHEKADAPQSHQEVEQLYAKLNQLESELKMLKTAGVSVKVEAPTASAQTKSVKKKTYKAPVGKINNVLKHATKKDLQTVKNHWNELLTTLGNQNMKSVAALLSGSEPVAASDAAFVVKFKYDIHCEKVMHSGPYLEKIASVFMQLIGKPLTMEGIPEAQWQQVREDFIAMQDSPEEQGHETKEEDPIIAEARKLVGDELLEIKD